MCVFSFQELRLRTSSNDGSNLNMSSDLVLDVIQLGDAAGARLHSIAASGENGSDYGGGSVRLAACTLGRLGAEAACSYAQSGVEGYAFHQSDDDDGNGNDAVPTNYESRFCNSKLARSKIDYPQAITIFRGGPYASSVLASWRETHGTNIQWAYDNGIGSEGHLLAKIVPCSDISSKFTDPTRMYRGLSLSASNEGYAGSDDDDAAATATAPAVCDYIEGGSSKTFAEEAFEEWERLCSVWPAGEGAGSCHRQRSVLGDAFTFVAAAAATLCILRIVYYEGKKRRKSGRRDSFGMFDSKEEGLVMPPTRVID